MLREDVGLIDTRVAIARDRRLLDIHLHRPPGTVAVDATPLNRSRPTPLFPLPARAGTVATWKASLTRPATPLRETASPATIPPARGKLTAADVRPFLKPLAMLAAVGVSEYARRKRQQRKADAGRAGSGGGDAGGGDGSGAYRTGDHA